MLNKIYWNLYIRYLATKWIFRKTLGDTVICDGKEYVLQNGVCFPSWDTGTWINGKRIQVRDEKCKKKYTMKGVIRSYRSGLWFYRTNWLDIWMREGIKPWMKVLKIW